MRQKELIIIIIFSISFLVCKADKYPRNYSIDILHYKFELNLSDSSDEINGKAYVTLSFKSEDVKQVRLDLINKSEQLAGKGMTVNAVIYEDGTPLFTHKKDELLIQLLKTPEKNRPYTFVISYYGIPASGLRIGKTRYGNRSFFSDDWPNKARNWLPTVDHPYEKATSEFVVVAPAKYRVISNGLLLEESDLGNGFKTTHWKQSVPVSCWLYVLGVAEFAVQHVGMFDNKSIQTWVHPQDREAGFKDFAEPTAAVLQYFSDYVGPFAYEKLANIQASSVSGGMEASSAIFYTEILVNGKADKRLRDVVIHELAHQWFGNAVTESSWDDVWLSEGFATYFTLLFQEYAYGHDEYIDGLKKARKTIFDFYKKDSSYKIVDDRSAEIQDVTNIVTYQKGAWTLHMLRKIIGHENFQKGIRSYYKKYFNANASTKDFIMEMENASGKDLKSFFNQWLNRPEVLKISVVWTYDQSTQKLKLTTSQMQSSAFIFETPIELQVIYQDGKYGPLIKFDMNAKQNQFEVSLDKKPSLIIADPKTTLLADIEIK